MEPLPPPVLVRLVEADASEREAAWARFVDEHSRLILHVARSLGGDYDAGMNRYAAALERLRENDFARLRKYRPQAGARFSTWLAAVARRLCVDHDRQVYGRDRSCPGSPPPDERRFRRRLVELAGEEVDAERTADSPEAGPEAMLEMAEATAALDAVLDELDPADRLLLKLRFEDDLSAREVAELLHLPTPFHVYRRLQRLLPALREALVRHGVEEANL